MDRMQKLFGCWVFILCGWVYGFPVLADSSNNDLVIHHDLQVIPDLASGSVSIKDQLQFNKPLTQALELQLGISFRLNSKQNARLDTDSLHILAEPNQTVQLEYSSKLASTTDCDWLKQTCVLLNERGLYLDPNLGWYAQVPNARHTFSLNVQLPADWLSVSQGEQQNQAWLETNPQDAIYVVAGPFKRYQEANAQVYLLHDDPELAKHYLQATQHYLTFYSDLLGVYPYKKFATVESFWETGWGMPSFTLLGSRVMRLPFIRDTSLPHEILHNWWGNGVYVDASQGNWSEGLTAYLSDYYLKELKGEDAAYRRDTLQNYAAFTQSGNDLPLSQFRSRHDQTTQAVGYGKSLMLFHALRQQLGNQAFFAALKQFYETYRFRAASFADLQKTFEQVSGQPLQALFDQTLNRTGAPKLALKQAQLTQQGQQTRLALTVGQLGDKPWQLTIPVVASFADGSQTTQGFAMDQSQQTFELTYPQAPVDVAIDPNFEVFRLPDAHEVPPALNVLFNDQPKHIVLQRKVTEGMEFAWDEWAEQLAKNAPHSTIQYDDQPLPKTGTMVLLGGDNEGLTQLLLRANQPFKLNDTAYILNSESYMCVIHSLALTLTAGKQQVILLDAPNPEALKTLARKVPHYGKYSYAIFNSLSGENVAKGQWTVTDSPLTLKLPPLQQ